MRILARGRKRNHLQVLEGHSHDGSWQHVRSETEEMAFLERMLRDDLSDEWGSAPAADW